MIAPTRRAVLAGAVAAAAPMPSSAATGAPRWRGFNLVEKLDAAHPAPFQEADFDIIADWEFNFVRLPMHYRIWTPGPGRTDEAQLREIDQAVAWGRARGIHVCLCLHTAPGYSIDGRSYAAERAAGRDLWADGATGEAARAAFAGEWAMLADRFRDVPGGALSFNLVNEPQEVSGAAYLRSATPAVAAIRRARPDRLVIADGTQGVDAGRRPVPALIPLGVAQSTRGYRPFDLTHYQAPWAFGSHTWPRPAWPVPNVMTQLLYGPEKPDFRSELVIDLDRDLSGELEIDIAIVSGLARLVVHANDEVVLDRRLQPGPGPGEWRTLFPQPDGGFMARYDRAYRATLPRQTRRLRLALADGDWLTFSALTLRPPGRAPIVITPGLASWALPQRQFRLRPDGQVVPADGAPARYDRTALWRDDILPWQALEAQGVFVHVGEWAANQWTPHDVVLAWMRDCLANWRQAGWGWALWNLRGEAGPLDSGRTDARLEPFRGHMLDRAMLDILREQG